MEACGELSDHLTLSYHYAMHAHIHVHDCIHVQSYKNKMEGASWIGHTVERPGLQFKELWATAGQTG